MTVTTNTNKVQALGNGATKTFPYSFRIYSASDLVVTSTDLTTGVDTVLALNTDYTVTGAGSYNGGNVVLSGSAPSNTTRITIRRVMAVTQGTDLRNQGAYFAETHEDVFDKLTMIAQQHGEALERSLTLSPTSDGVSVTLPNPSGSNVIGWNEAGNALQNYPPVDNTLLSVQLAASAGASLVGFDGTNVADVITNRLSRVVNSISALRAVDSTKYTHALVSGYYAAADGGGGVYYYDSTDTTTADNGGTVIVAADGGRWKLVVQDVVSVRQFGAKGNGTTDDSAAIQAAVTAFAGKTIRIPTGTYRMVTGITIPANTSIVGDGMFATVLAPVSASMVALSQVNAVSTVAKISISDLTIDASATGVATAGVTGVKFVLCQDTELQNISFLACSYDFDIDRGRFHNLRSLRSSGTAIAKAGRGRIYSSSDTDYCYLVTLDGYFIENIGNGTQGPSLFTRRVVGSQFSQINANDLNVGNGGSPADFIVVENDCQGNKYYANMCAGPAVGIRINTGSGVAVAPSFCTFTDNDIDQAYVSAILVSSGNWLQITGGNYTASGVNAGGTAVNIGAANHVVVDGVIVQGYTTSPSGTALNLGGTSNVIVTNSLFESNHIALGFSGTVSAKISNNRALNCTNKVAGTSSQAGVWISDNPGINPLTSVAAPAFPASGAAYTNTTGVPIRITWSGGTLSGIAINGIAGFLSLPWVILNPGETITFTYTGSPAWAFAPF